MTGQDRVSLVAAPQLYARNALEAQTILPRPLWQP